MNCREAEQQIFAERDGALAEAGRAALAAHVAHCAACRQIRDNLQAGVERWRTEVAGVRLPSADMEWQKLRRRMSDAPAERKHPIATWIAVPLGAAAAVAIGLYVTPSQQPATPSAAPAVVAARPPSVSSATGRTSTVVYVDDKSGWTFVWAPDSNGGQHI